MIAPILDPTCYANIIQYRAIKKLPHPNNILDMTEIQGTIEG